jgi:hypothetical protein
MQSYTLSGTQDTCGHIHFHMPDPTCPTETMRGKIICTCSTKRAQLKKHLGELFSYPLHLINGLMSGVTNERTCNSFIVIDFHQFGLDENNAYEEMTRTIYTTRH